MQNKLIHFKQLPVLYNEHGEIRTVGFELEYTNLGIDESVKIVQKLYGGSVQKESRFRQKVVGTSLGEFTVEFDLALLTEKRYKKPFESVHIKVEKYKIGHKTLEDELEDALESVVGKIFPYEIACPPVACTQLHELEKLRQALYQHRAEGTTSFLTNAFGTHINIETPDTSTETILTYLRAFILLYPWLLQVGDTDFARRMSPFIDPFPEEYVALVLSQNYTPDLEKLILDYHQYNPDRNRPLDLYPLFDFLRNDILEQYRDMGKVKPRKTFHYRLPNSSISEPDWTLAKEWNNWVVVEELATDREKVAQHSWDYLTLKEETLIGFESKWVKRIREWVS